MILTELGVARFRVVEQLSISPHPSLNLVTGINGSGKSSILEAIQCLATGHTFRTRRPRELISHETPSYLLTSTFFDLQTKREHRAGLERWRDGKINLRLDYEEIKSQAQIARLLPVKAITPESHRLIQESPDERRQFLDWGLFHVEHTFLAHWQQYRRALSQRNQLLRDGSPESDITNWNLPLVSAATVIDELRRSYVQKLLSALQDRLVVLEQPLRIDLRYRRGWANEEDLENLLVKNISTHRKMKTTTDGPHRADLAIYCDDVLAKHVMSRGQQKMLVYLMHLAQLDILATTPFSNAIILCDDLTSELDETNLHAIIKQLISLQSQIFISGTNLGSLTRHDHERFHMEHGHLEKGL